MARIWQEGFEDGLPYEGYLEGNPSSNQIYSVDFDAFPGNVYLTNGRNIYSQKSLFIYRDEFTKLLPISLSELYFRCYVKTDDFGNNVGPRISFYNISGSIVLQINCDNISTGLHSIKANIAGTLTSMFTFYLQGGSWSKIDIRIKVDSVSGLYDVRLNDLSINSGSSLNFGTSNIGLIMFGTTTNSYGVNWAIDDIALNDTSGSVNNSWCGSGTIVSLKPKGAGNKAQWDTCTGYATAESGTNTTNIKVTGHGLATNDVIYNKTRNAYRIITYVDANNFTVSSVTSQTTSDVILLYKNVATIAAGTGTSTSKTVLSGHTMQSGDVIVNTTRSNAIRKIVYVSGNEVYNYVSISGIPIGTLGSQVTSQASGDSIKTFAFTSYAMANHWEAVSNQTDPSPKLSYIQSLTSGDIDTFDMEELVSDKGLPSGSTVVALSHNIYAQEAGAGSQIKPVFRISGTDYEGDAQTLSSGTLQYQKIYETSPATSSAWSRSEIDGLEAGVKLV
jgi:hypothetical protein